MLRYSKAQKRRLAAYILVLLLSSFTRLPPFSTLHSPDTFLFIGLVLAWGLSVRGRILQRRVRRLLSGCCGFMILIFVVRLCRYDLFRELAPVTEYALYLYGVCYTMTALLAFLTALCVGRGEENTPRRLLLPLWLAEGLLCAVMLTNPLHRFFYVFEPGGQRIAAHGPVYYLMALWSVAFAIAAIALLLHRCRNSFSRRWWFLPAGGFAFGAALLGWYFAAGGAPSVGGYKLFNMQEAFCLTVILPFEAMFRIGLIPTNSDYELLFRRSAMKAAILDAGGETALASLTYEPAPREGERAQRAPIPGGSVVWFEDIGELLRLRGELTAVNEELAAENELIREEKELREEQIGYETRNRLYDSISETLRPQAETMRRLLEAEGGEADFRGRLEKLLLMGAYMKRMGNLMLLADGKRSLPVGELALSVSESFEYLRLGGVACALDYAEEASLPTPQLLACYRTFEGLMEANYGAFHACALSLLPEPGTLLRLALDCPELHGAEAEDLPTPGLMLKTEWEDETWFVTLCRTPPKEVGA